MIVFWESDIQTSNFRSPHTFEVFLKAKSHCSHLFFYYVFPRQIHSRSMYVVFLVELQMLKINVKSSCKVRKNQEKSKMITVRPWTTIPFIVFYLYAFFGRLDVIPCFRDPKHRIFLRVHVLVHVLPFLCFPEAYTPLFLFSFVCS